MAGRKVLFCDECGYELEDRWVRSNLKLNQEFLVRECSKASYMGLLGHYRDLTTTYRKRVTNFDPYTGKENAS
jgi:hypothetical protein